MATKRSASSKKPTQSVLSAASRALSRGKSTVRVTRLTCPAPRPEMAATRSDPLHVTNVL